MHTSGYHVNLHKPHKNVLVQIPLTLLQRQIYSRQHTALCRSQSQAASGNATLYPYTTHNMQHHGTEKITSLQVYSK